MEALYDDCGQVMPLATRSNARTLRRVFKRLAGANVQVVEGDNRYHDLPFDFVEFMGRHPLLRDFITAPDFPVDDAMIPFDELNAGLDYVWDRFAEHRVFLPDSKGALRGVEPCLIHGDAWDELVAMGEAGLNWEGDPLSKAEVFDRIVGLAKGMRSLGAGEGSGAEALGFGMGLGLLDGLREIGAYEGVSYGDRKELSEIVGALLSSPMKTSEAKALFDPAASMRLVMRSLNSMNIKLAPMAYASQDYENEIGKRYAGFVGKVSWKVSQGQARDD